MGNTARRDSGCVVSVCLKTADEFLGPQEVDLRLNAGRVQGPLVDLSMNGIAMVLPERLADGDTLHLRLVNRRIDRTVDATATVLKTVADGAEWETICRLDQKLALEDVHEFTRLIGAAELV